MGERRHPVAIRRQRSFQRSSSPNRSWSSAIATARVAVAGNTKVLVGSFTLSNPNIDETVLRTVGLIAIASDQVAATEDQIGAFGLIQVTDLAIAAGAASIPGPTTNASDDGWFAYQAFAQTLQFGTLVGFQPQMATQYHFDSKAKRRSEEGQNLAVMVENNGTTGFVIMAVFRLLSMVSGT